MADQSAIRLKSVTKVYGENTVLDASEWAVQIGEIHGLVGENGAGKSTLIKIISGATPMSSGELTVFGEQRTFPNSLAAQSCGIQTVFQELTLIPDLSVAQNLFHVRKPDRKWHRSSVRQLADQTRLLFERLELEFIDPFLLVRDLPLYVQQLLEIAKALAANPRLLILDEATSSLLGPHVEWLYSRVQDLRESGGTVIFTSHRWDEVRKFTDRISVMRGGRFVETLRTIEADEAYVTKLMTGRELNLVFPQLPTPSEDVAMSVSNLSTSSIHDISFELHKGEIIGVGGLSGQGQRDIFLSLFGAAARTGTIEIMGQSLRSLSPRDAIKRGIALVPEDRKVGGIAALLSIRDNILLPTLQRNSRLGFVKYQDVAEKIEGAMEILKIRATPNALASTLSGGNQQKVVLAKWLFARSEVFLLYDVTRGVDVGTKHDIYRLMADLASEGKAVLFFSTETLELVHMSHRVMVLYEGRIVDMLQGDGLSFSSIVGSSLGTAAGGSL